MSFVLDQRLETSSFHITRCGNIEVRLADDSRYVWLLLIPEMAGMEELHDLPDDLRDRLIGLATDLGGWMKHAFTADKINIAALGNLVPQLHLHIVARQRGDAAWPGPIWGHGEPLPRTETDRRRLITAVAKFLENGETGCVSSTKSAML
jgi:diadenosine tetraphosphate (Ap4A) HIT family hydrolase